MELESLIRKIVREELQKIIETQTNEQAEKKEERQIELSFIERKRASFDIDIELLKGLKIYATETEKPIYQIIESAIMQYLEKHDDKWDDKKRIMQYKIAIERDKELIKAAQKENDHVKAAHITSQMLKIKKYMEDLEKRL